MISELQLNEIVVNVSAPQTILAEGPLFVGLFKIFHSIFSTVLKQLDSRI